MIIISSSTTIFYLIFSRTYTFSNMHTQAHTHTRTYMIRARPHTHTLLQTPQSTTPRTLMVKKKARRCELCSHRQLGHSSSTSRARANRRQPPLTAARPPRLSVRHVVNMFACGHSSQRAGAKTHHPTSGPLLIKQINYKNSPIPLSHPGFFFKVLLFF